MKSLKERLKKIKWLRRLVLCMRLAPIYLYRFNLIKTIYINFKLFPFKTAIKLPIWIYGRIHFLSLKGNVIIDAPIETRMIKFGLNEENIGMPKSPYLLDIKGTLVFKGYVTFSINGCLRVSPNAILQIGNFSFFGNSTRVICTKKIILGELFIFSFESQLFDTDFHYMKDINTGEVKSAIAAVIIGDRNWVGNRTTIMKGTQTPKNCTIASNSLLNKDYTILYPENIIIGGKPAKCLKENVIRLFNPVEYEYNSYFKNERNQGKSLFIESGIIPENPEDIKRIYTYQ